jgi:hypothetical protein
MLFCTSINIGPPYNLYYEVDSGYVSSWLFAPPYWRGFYHVNLCAYFFPNSNHLTNILGVCLGDSTKDNLAKRN